MNNPHCLKEGNFELKSTKLVLIRILSIVLVVCSVFLCGFTIVKYNDRKLQFESNVKLKESEIDNQQKQLVSVAKAIENCKAEYQPIVKDISNKSSLVSQKKGELTRLLNKKNGKAKVCYLTFDDGPSDNTLKIINILKEKDAKGTFFVTGSGNSSYMKKIVDSGNQIALHTYSHDYEDIYESTDAYFKDLNKISNLVKQKTGVDAKVIRFPGGSSNTISRNYCNGIMTKLSKMVEDRGYKYFDWDVDSTDAMSDSRSATDIFNAVKRNLGGRTRVTILMHDTGAKKSTVQALPRIIDYLRNEGFEFVALTVDSPAVHHGINN